MEDLRDSYIRHNEGRRELFLIPLNVKSTDGREAFLSFTDYARNSINRDRRRFYDVEDGPNFAISVAKATEYAEYVDMYATPYNLHRFTTRDNTFVCFFAGPPPGRK